MSTRSSRIASFVARHQRVSRFKVQPIRQDHTDLLEALYIQQVRTVDRDRLRRQDLPRGEYRETLRRWEHAFRRFVRLARGHPVFAGFGSARDSVMEQPCSVHAREIISLVGEMCYLLGIGLMTGHFHRGWMWACLQAWLSVRSRALAESKSRRHDGVFISGVPLMEPDDATGGHGPIVPTSEQARLLELVDALSPPHATFESRSPAIMGCAQTLVCVYGPDGIGTSEELIRDILGEQHREISNTVWTGQPKTGMRKICLVDYRLPSGFWGYDWVLLKASGNVALTSTNAVDWNSIHIIRIGDGNADAGPLAILGQLPVHVHWFADVFEAAEFIVTMGIEVHEALRLAYLALLTNGSGGNGGNGH